MGIRRGSQIVGIALSSLIIEGRSFWHGDAVVIPSRGGTGNRRLDAPQLVQKPSTCAIRRATSFSTDRRVVFYGTGQDMLHLLPGIEVHGAQLATVGRQLADCPTSQQAGCQVCAQAESCRHSLAPGGYCTDPPGLRLAY